MSTTNDTEITLSELAFARAEARRLKIELPKRLTAMSMHCKNWFLVEGDGFRKEVCAFNAYEAKAKAIHSILNSRHND
jgi:hypothetical protein